MNITKQERLTKSSHFGFREKMVRADREIDYAGYAERISD
jgi:hypothetical protein